MKQAFLADVIFTGESWLSQHAVLANDFSICGLIARDLIPSDFEIHSFEGCFITPAFVDLQLYGGNGKLFSHSLNIEALESTYSYCKSGGCAHFMITMATNSIENFNKGIDVVKEYIQSG